MDGIFNKILAMLKKLGYFTLQYAYVLLYWTIKFFKVQMQKWKKCSVQKKLEKAYAGFGSEVYAIYKQTEVSDWKDIPSVQQQLRQVEEAESKVFQMESVVDEINAAYSSKREEIKQKYEAKRAEIDQGASSEASEV